MSGRIMLSAIAVLMLATPADAQQSAVDIVKAEVSKWLGTTSVSAQPYFSDGSLSGCSYVFDALANDFAYRQGGFLKVSGSLSAMDMNGKLGTTLKVVVNELNIDKNGSVTTAPSPPSRIFLMGENYKTNLSSLVAAQNSDTPGGLFAIFQPEPTLGMIVSATQQGKFTIAFNQKSGETDITLPIDLTVVDTDNTGQKKRGDEPTRMFAECILTLLKAAKDE